MWKSIVAPAVVVSVFWLIVGGTTSYYLFWQSKALDRLLEENVTSIRAASEMQQTVWRIQSNAFDAANDRSHIPDEQLIALESQFVDSLEVAEASATTTAEWSYVRTIREQFSDYATRLRKTTTDVASDQMTVGDLLPVVSGITATCEELVRFNEQLLRDASRRRQHFTAWIVYGRVLILIIGPGLGLLMGFRLAGQLNRSMTRISVSLQSVAGDLEQEIGRLKITPQATLPAIQTQLDVVANRMRGVVKELHQARQETMRAERLAAVGELAAGVAHELRNPLTSVKLLIQTMEHRLRPSVPMGTFDVVLEEINRMETTIQGLLDFARPPKLHRALHDLPQIARRAVNLIDGKARQNGVRISGHFPVAPFRVYVDAEQLHQVCINLLLNGIESMSAGGDLEIHFTLNEAATAARVRFQDTGPGIPENILSRLFEPFVTSKAHGTGLGLAVSRRIILNHSGNLTAENCPGGGAALVIELPLDQEHIRLLESHAHLVSG